MVELDVFSRLMSACLRRWELANSPYPAEQGESVTAIEGEDVSGPNYDPVDVQHVLAAIILAVRAGEIDSTTSLTIDNVQLLETLRHHVKHVFDTYGGRLGDDES